MRISFLLSAILFSLSICNAQQSFNRKFNNSSVQAGIEVGAKGIKLSVLEIGKNAKINGAFNILKDSSVNTDFISFTPATFQATLKGLTSMYTSLTREYQIAPENVYTVVSSGVKIQA
ncbi:MAG TPA: hypothetical protein VLJ68_01315, partial [Chitinophagaceae bacterium]|nr:hypothetical protein [Chitinophagaceae bacterium]